MPTFPLTATPTAMATTIAVIVSAVAAVCVSAPVAVIDELATYALTSLEESAPSSSCPTKLRATAMPIDTPTAVEPEPATAMDAATTSAVIDELPVAVTVTSCAPTTSL